MANEHDNTSAESFIKEMEQRREAAESERTAAYVEPVPMPRAYARAHAQKGLTAQLMRTGIFSSEEQLGVLFIAVSIVGVIASVLLMWPKDRPSSPIPRNLVPTPYAEQTPQVAR